MMKYEFEEMTNTTLTDEQYKGIEILYMDMADDMTKAEFVKMMTPAAKKMSTINEAKAKAEEMENQPLIFVCTDDGECYWHDGYWAKVVGGDIATGKILVRNLTYDEYARNCGASTVYTESGQACGVNWTFDYKAKQVKLVK